MNIVKSKFSDKSWVVNSKSKRISDKVYICRTFEVGPFFVVEHLKGTIIYLSKCEEKVGDFSATYCYKKNRIFNGYYYFETEQGPLIYNSEGMLVSQDISLEYIIDGIIEDLIPAFSEKHKYWGYIDCNLQWKIPPIYKEAGLFNLEGFAIVKFKDNERTSVIDKKHNILFSPKKVLDASFIQTDMLQIKEVVSRTGICCSQMRKGLMNLSGKIIVEPKCLEIVPFGMVFFIKTDNGWQFVDKHGNERPATKYEIKAMAEPLSKYYK